jgi:hypothetical protein
MDQPQAALVREPFLLAQKVCAFPNDAARFGGAKQTGLGH